MKLRDYIDTAIKVTGTRPKLANMLGINAMELADARNRGCGLPRPAQEKLAAVLKCSPEEIFSASHTVFSVSEMNDPSHESPPCERCASHDDCPYPSEKDCSNFANFRKH